MKTTETSDRQSSAAGPHPLNSKPDFTVSDYSTVFLFHPLTERATAWLQEHCPEDDEHQYIRCALVVEHRYIQYLLRLAIHDGLTPPSEFCN